MTTNIYLARLLAEERERDIRQYAEARRRLRESEPPREHSGSWLARLFHRGHAEVTGATCAPA
jgi:hypothetical protein